MHVQSECDLCLRADTDVLSVLCECGLISRIYMHIRIKSVFMCRAPMHSLSSVRFVIEV
jgi:hypothetical protein